MSYRRVLVFRWSTRDVLAVLVLAVIVAFLTGSVLFYVTANEKPLTIAQEYQPAGQVSEYASVQQAQASATQTDLVVRFVEVDHAGHLLVENTESKAQQAAQFGLESWPPPAEGGQDNSRDTRTVTLGTNGTETAVHVMSREQAGIFPDRWYMTNATVVDRLGASGAFVISPPETATGTADSPSKSQATIRSTLLFFELGTDQVLRGFVLLVITAGVLAAVTIASVVQMTVRDRLQTIQIIRATGGTARSIIGLFGFRGLLLTGTAIAMGYAIGVIVSSVVTSIAVFTGLPTTLSPRVTVEAVRLLALVYTPILVIGCVSAVLATIPVVWRPTARLTDPVSKRSSSGAVVTRLRRLVPGGSYAETKILDWRAVLPTVAAVAVFAAIVLLVTASGVVAEPLTTESSATVLEPGAAHPVDSTVPASYAAAFRSQTVAASPEILIFGVVNDNPTIIRGANYSSFAAVTDASLVDGRPMQAESEALVGADLAQTQNITVGETMVVGSGTQTTVERVRVVGIYQAPGAHDDQLLVSLASAQHLTTAGPGEVNFVRLSEAVQQGTEDSGIRVVSVEAAGTLGTANTSVTFSVVNTAQANQSRTISVEVSNRTVRETVSLPPGARESVRTTVPIREPGEYRVSVGDLTTQLTVKDPRELALTGVPDEAPLGSTPLIRVETIAGSPAENATVTVGNQTVTTDPRGYARVPLTTRGTRTIRATKADYSVNTSITVTESARRTVQASLAVRPNNVSEFSQPTAQVSLYNPWNTTAVGNIQIQGPESGQRSTYQLESGQARQYDAGLARLPAGTYAVTVLVNGSQTLETTYEVSGNDRLSTVILRNTETTAGSGLGAAIAVVFGNLTVVVAALIGLAGMMVSGALVASFARTIHARRETLGVYRATGASPRVILSTVLRDTLRIGIVSVLLGVSLGALLLSGIDAVEPLVFFGIRVSPSLSPTIVATVSAIALGVVLLGALLPTIAALRRAPAASFTRITKPSQERDND